METIKIGILGLGTVGSGVIRILRDHAEKISNITGRRLEVKTVVVHNLKKKRSVDLTGINLTDNADDVLCDDEIQMVVEVMGTVNIAKEINICFMTRFEPVDFTVVSISLIFL